jgi:PncC family amidohydrolase
MKRELLGIDAALIEQHTSVSEEAARAMADSARTRTGSTYALSITGEAGPVSATGAIPGTVFIGFAGSDGLPEAWRIHLPGDRNRVRMLAAQTALDQLRKKLPG